MMLPCRDLPVRRGRWSALGSVTPRVALRVSTISGGVPGDPGPVVRRMVGDDQHAVARRQVLLGQLPAGHPQVGVVSHRRQRGDVRVVVLDLGPLVQQQLHQLEAGRLARVVNVLLVGHAQQSDLAPLDRLAPVVERVGDPGDDVGGHRGVDLAGQLDEPGGQPVLAGDPGQVERVDRDAVATQPGAGIEGLEAERLGPGRLDHLPDVDPHAGVDHLQLVDQGDVDGAIGVLEDLAGLGDLGAGDGDDPDDHLAVQRRGELEAGRVEAADDLGDGGRRELGVARVLALGAEGQEEVDARPEPAGGQQRQDDLAGGARVGGALEDHELAGPQPLGDRAGRVDDVGQVRLARLGQRGGDADDDDVGLVEPAEVDGGLEEALPHRPDRRRAGCA